MVKHFCDKCGKELHAEDIKRQIAGEVYYDLCEDCVEELLVAVEDFVTGDWYSPEEQKKPTSNEAWGCWHDMKLGFPSKRGAYLVTIRFDNGSTSHRIAKYSGSPCWYKMGKAFGLIEEEGVEVVAWTELPEPYERKSD